MGLEGTLFQLRLQIALLPKNQQGCWAIRDFYGDIFGVLFIIKVLICNKENL